ncbi:MAG: GLUG motif-containing protein [Balneolaceae bacterium]|nr:GLUG motif-containing protein [Balneolaceae bacterium]
MRSETIMDAHYILVADIDLTTATGDPSGAYWNGGDGWDPIATYNSRFKGSFNGNGHTITGLFIDRRDENYIGLFGAIDAGVELSNIGMVAVDLTGDRYAGGLVGVSIGEVMNSYATGNVKGNFIVGGLVGQNLNGDITGSYATANVNISGNTAGGLVGLNDGSISNSHATGSVNGAFNISGLVGTNGGIISNTYATGNVSGTGLIGGLVGSIEPGNTITNSYWNTETSGTNTGAGEGDASGTTGLTSTQMRQEASFTDFDFTDTWQIESGMYTSYPYLQEITYDEPGAEPEVNPIPGLFRIFPDENNVLFVDQNVDGGDGSGNSWENAIPELRDALSWAGENWDGDTDGTLQIWVADGLYVPTSDDTDRGATFLLVNNVEIYGGFDGGESSLSGRDWETNETILSGDIDGNDNPFAPDTDSDNYSETLSQTDHIQGTNSYHVVTGSGTGNTALLDGFTITAGNTYNASAPHQNGGGIYNENGNPTLKNLVIEGNRALLVGGGIFNTENSFLTLNNVVLAHNTAFFGGGMANDNSRSTLVNVRMESNSAYAEGGAISGGLNGSLLIINAVFVDNSALGSGAAGGALSIGDSDVILINATVVNNSAENGIGGAIFSNGDMRIVNSIFWGNSAEDEANEFFNGEDATTDIKNSILNVGGADDVVREGTLVCNSCSDLDPIFADPVNGDYTLQHVSPAINAGTNAPYESGGDAEGMTTDFAGNDRIYDGGTVDMGAYEFQGEPLLPPDPIVLTAPEDEAVNVSLSPEFTWEPDETVTNYRLIISENNDFSDFLIDESDNVNNTYEPPNNLENSTTYYWKVQGLNEAGSGEWSEVFSFSTIPESSEIVILTDPADEAEDVPLRPLFEWNQADGADTYDLVVSPNGDFSDPVINESEITDTEFQTTTELDFSTMYYWRVRGVNTGGAGDWSETFSFTTLDQPEASDNRILVANNQSYTFSPADFGVTDNNYIVIIEDMSGFNGVLELDGGEVSTSDEISVGNIDNEQLIYTPSSEEYGYGYDSFQFSIKDAGGNTSEDSYTMSLDVAATSVNLSYEGEGWRFLSSPADGETVGDLFEPIWTQGFPGSDSPGADFANIQTAKPGRVCVGAGGK